MTSRTLSALRKIAAGMDPNSALALSRAGGAHARVTPPATVAAPNKAPHTTPAPSREEVEAASRQRIAGIKPGQESYMWWNLPQSTRIKFTKAGVVPGHIKNPTAPKPPDSAS